MRKSKAWAETLVLSAVIAAFMCAAAYYSFGAVFFFFIMFLLAAAAHFRVVFRRHKELGTAFLFITALCSTALQYIVMFLLFHITGWHPSFSGEGHPDGGTLLIYIALMAEPFLIHAASLVILFIRRVKWLFGEN